jgi:hypothetical protein
LLEGKNNVLEGNARVEANLYRDNLGSVYGITNATAKPHLHLAQPRDVFIDPISQEMGKHIIDLPHMADRIFSCCCLGSARTVKGYETIDLVAPPHLSRIGVLCRSPQNGEIHSCSSDAGSIQCIQANRYLLEMFELTPEIGQKGLMHSFLSLEVFRLVFHILVDQGNSYGKG